MPPDDPVSTEKRWTIWRFVDSQGKAVSAFHATEGGPPEFINPTTIEAVEVVPASSLAELEVELAKHGYHGFSCQDEFQAWLDAGSPSQWSWTNPLDAENERLREALLQARADIAAGHSADASRRLSSALHPTEENG